jgi:hypothetical protein
VAKKNKKLAKGDEKVNLTTEYNRLTNKVNKAIKEYTEKRWSRFLGKLGPHPTSSSAFWNIINKARTQKSSSSIPTLVVGERFIKTDKDKANLFATSLAETFTEDIESTDFDRAFYTHVEETVANFDYGDSQFPEVTLTELKAVIKSLKDRSSPGEDGIQNVFLKHLTERGLNLFLKLVNLSIAQGLPDAWKIATITMIPKKGW